jgi:hypothetical protein
MILLELKQPNNYLINYTIWELLTADKIYKLHRKYLFLHFVEED